MKRALLPLALLAAAFGPALAQPQAQTPAPMPARIDAPAAAPASATLPASPSSPASAPAPGPAAAPADLRNARALVDAKDYAAALPIYEALLAARPDDSDLLIEVARVNGFADRNAEAARLYRRVLEVAPQRRRDVLPSLAWQTLWAGDAAGAEPLFIEAASLGLDPANAWRGVAESRQSRGDLAGARAAYLEALRISPEDPNSARRAAQMSIWLGRYDEGIAEFRALVARDPADRRSRLGLARALNDAGRHRAAVAEYRGPGLQLDDDARFDYARALRWSGFDDLAHAELQTLPQADAAWLRDYRTARELKPWLRAGYQFATDRDKLDVRSATLAAGWNLPGGRAFEVGVRRLRLDEPGRRATGTRLEGGWRWRIGDPGSPWGPLWPSVTIGLNRYGDWHPVTGGARVRWLPRDDLRLDGELVREAIETPLALANRVHVDVASLGADWRPHPLWTLAGSLSQLRFDDGNQRTRLNARVEHTLYNRPRVRAGFEAMGFRSTDPSSATRPGRGYWNPRDYREARLYVSLLHEVRPWELYARVGIGTAREVDGWGIRSSGNPHLWELAAVLDIHRALQLRLYAGGSGSGMGLAGGGSGYWRRYVGAELTGWF